MNKIKDIYWERVNLHLVLNEVISGEVYLLDEMGKKHPLPYKENEIIINVTNVTNGDMLEDGKFDLLIDDEQVSIESALLKQIDNFSKVFKYRSFYALVIELHINENFGVYLESSYMMKNKHYKKNFMLREASGLKKKLITLVKILFPFCINIFYGFLRLLKPKSTDRVLFLSENDDEPRGNLKALYDYFITNNLGKTKGMFYNKFAKKSIPVLIKSVVSIAFSDVIVVDNYVPLINTLNISKNQRIIQLWHAGVGFKSVGYARFGEVGSPHPFKSSHRKYTTAIVDDERLVDIYKEVFAMGDDIFKAYGMPRLDGYLSEDKIKDTVNKLFQDNPLLKDKKIILFSPTYRGIGASVASYDYSKLDFMEPVNAATDPEIARFLHAAEMLSEKAGHIVPVEASVGGAFTIVSFLRGIEILLRDCRKNPEQIHRIMRLVTDSQKSCVDSLAKYGVGIAMADPVANPALIGPRFYEKFVYPYTKELTDYIYEKTQKKVSLHMCGETRSIWKYLSQYKVNEISLDNIVDLEQAALELGSQVPIAGNVDPVQIVMKGTKEDIFEGVRNCIEKGRLAAKGFHLTTGCDIPDGTAIEKVDWFMEAARKYGKM